MPAETVAPRPPWIRTRFRASDRYRGVIELLRAHDLSSVCEEAACPNISECFGAGTATFMILGDICTRACGFCAVTSGRPTGLDLGEAARLAEAIAALELNYAVITSVDRDDLADGGAGMFAACIRAIRERRPDCGVEVLIPDFEGNWDALATVIEAGPAVLNHNIETVPRLYPRVRPNARYERSLELISHVRALGPSTATKSGLMVGLGETFEELVEAMSDLYDAGCELVTIGQYLRPTAKHLPVARYYEPSEFDALAAAGRELGLMLVEAGPLVRSSYHAAEQADAAAARRSDG
ncbi:MAG TPA: lipoyl synthase [Dehalococcoidia bacterium]|nr:lipoyl synthase [Dehalococcoidia bacterium]